MACVCESDRKAVSMLYVADIDVVVVVATDQKARDGFKERPVCERPRDFLEALGGWLELFCKAPVVLIFRQTFH